MLFINALQAIGIVKNPDNIGVDASEMNCRPVLLVTTRIKPENQGQ